MKQGVAQVRDERTGEYKDPVIKKFKTYRVSSGGSYRMRPVVDNQNTDYKKMFLEGYMTEPAFKRLQEFTGGALRPEEIEADTSGLERIAAREPEIHIPLIANGVAKNPVGQAMLDKLKSPRKKPGRKPKAKGGE